MCGGVAFEIRGERTPIQYCHAQRCRKATGSAYSPELLTTIEGFQWVSGEDLITVFEAPIIRAPPAYKRAFCRRCGTPLPVAIEGTPFMILQAGVLDDDPETRPFRHAFVGQGAPWHEIADALPQFDGQPPVPKRYQGGS